MKLSAARLFVHALDAARAFYVDTLGLPLLYGSAASGWLVLDAGAGVQLVVEAVDAHSPAEDRALVGRFTGLSFAVADIAARHAALVAQGVPFAEPPERQLWGGITATFLDPSGNALQLVQHPT
jgi:catechol 2,3-dioxygenase-like lactoylglutathione lyase family enzyme